jgi:SAM-dependent methyltransferase
MSELVFNAYSRYYDLLYRDKDYAGEAAYIQRILSRYGVSKGDLLEFGSGTGKHARLLAADGYAVHGIELSAEMVSKAETVPGFTCQQGDIATTTMSRYYDSVLALFHVISYQISNTQLLSVFSNAAVHLKPGGLFIFDFWYSPAVYAQKPVVRIKRMADGQVEIIRIAEPDIRPNENRVDVNYTIYARDMGTGIVQTLHETHPMRHFTLPEIDILASVHGFEVLAAEEFLTGNNPSESTWGVCVILKRVPT